MLNLRNVGQDLLRISVYKKFQFDEDFVFETPSPPSHQPRSLLLGKYTLLV